MTRNERVRPDQARREFVKQLAAALPLAGVLGAGRAAAGRAFGQDKKARQQDQSAIPSDVIVRQNDPDNFEYPFARLQDFLTPNDRFYVRNHFAVPETDADWRVSVAGAGLGSPSPLPPVAATGPGMTRRTASR